MCSERETICVWAFWQTSSPERPENIWMITIDLLTFLVSSGCDGIRRYFHYKADHDPKNCFFAGAYGYVYVIVPVTGVLIMIFSLMNAIDVAHMGI